MGRLSAVAGDWVLDLVPTAKVGHIGIYREPHSLEPVEYSTKRPAELPEARVILVDPTLTLMCRYSLRLSTGS